MSKIWVTGYFKKWFWHVSKSWRVTKLKLSVIVRSKYRMSHTDKLSGVLEDMCDGIMTSGKYDKEP